MNISIRLHLLLDRQYTLFTLQIVYWVFPWERTSFFRVGQFIKSWRVSNKTVEWSKWWYEFRWMKVYVRYYYGFHQFHIPFMAIVTLAFWLFVCWHEEFYIWFWSFVLQFITLQKIVCSVLSDVQYTLITATLYFRQNSMYLFTNVII